MEELEFLLEVDIQPSLYSDESEAIVPVLKKNTHFPNNQITWEPLMAPPAIIVSDNETIVTAANLTVFFAVLVT